MRLIIRDTKYNMQSATLSLCMYKQQSIPLFQKLYAEKSDRESLTVLIFSMIYYISACLSCNSHYMMLLSGFPLSFL